MQICKHVHSNSQYPIILTSTETNTSWQECVEEIHKVCDTHHYWWASPLNAPIIHQSKWSNNWMIHSWKKCQLGDFNHLISRSSSRFARSHWNIQELNMLNIWLPNQELVDGQSPMAAYTHLWKARFQRTDLREGLEEYHWKMINRHPFPCFIFSFQNLKSRKNTSTLSTNKCWI